MLEASREGAAAAREGEGLDAAAGSEAAGAGQGASPRAPSAPCARSAAGCRGRRGKEPLLRATAAAVGFSVRPASVPAPWGCACPFGTPAAPGSGQPAGSGPTRRRACPRRVGDVLPAGDLI